MNNDIISLQDAIDDGLVENGQLIQWYNWDSDDNDLLCNIRIITSPVENLVNLVQSQNWDAGYLFMNFVSANDFDYSKSDGMISSEVWV